MKILFDLFPVILFFAAYKLFDIYVATAVAMAASVVQIGWLKLRKRPVEPMMWIGFVIIVLAGGATLFLQNELFVKWKPSIVMVVMAIAVAVAQFGFGKNPIALAFNNQIKAPDALWRKLSFVWIAFFLFMALLNLYFVYFQSTDMWALYTTFGDMALMIVFVFAQMYWLYPYLPDDAAGAAGNGPKES